MLSEPLALFRKNKMQLEIFTDGGARGNPGPAGIGVVIFSKEDGLETEIFQKSAYIGRQTNNTAEYQAFVAALEWLHSQKLDCEKASFYLDSKLVVEQTQGNWKVKELSLKPLVAKAKKLYNTLPYPTSLSHVPRSQNKEADALVNQALDAHLA